MSAAKEDSEMATTRTTIFPICISPTQFLSILIASPQTTPLLPDTTRNRSLAIMSSASSSSAEPVGPRSQLPRRKVAFVSPLGVDDEPAEGASVEEHVPISQGTDDGESCVESNAQNDLRFVLFGHESNNHTSPVVNSLCTSPTTTRPTETGRSVLDTISSLWHSEGSLLHKLEDAWDQGNSITRGSMIGAGAVLLGGLALGSAYLGTRLTDYDFGRTPPSNPPPQSIALQQDNENDLTTSLVDRFAEMRRFASHWGPSAATSARSAAGSVDSVMQQARQAASGWYDAARSRLTDLDGSVLSIVTDRWS